MIVARGYRGFGAIGDPGTNPGDVDPRPRAWTVPPPAPKRSAGWLVFGAGLAAAWAGGWLLAAYWPHGRRR